MSQGHRLELKRRESFSPVLGLMGIKSQTPLIFTIHPDFPTMTNANKMTSQPPISLQCLKSMGNKWEPSHQSAQEIHETRGRKSKLLILKAFWTCSQSIFPKIDVLLWNQFHDFSLVCVLLSVSFLSLPTNTVIPPSYGCQNKKFQCNINQRK